MNKGTGTKTTVLMHVGVGDHVVETRDACVDTPWKDHVIATMSNLKHRFVSEFYLVYLRIHRGGGCSVADPAAG